MTELFASAETSTRIDELPSFGTEMLVERLIEFEPRPAVGLQNCNVAVRRDVQLVDQRICNIAYLEHRQIRIQHLPGRQPEQRPHIHPPRQAGGWPKSFTPYAVSSDPRRPGSAPSTCRTPSKETEHPPQPASTAVVSKKAPAGLVTSAVGAEADGAGATRVCRRHPHAQGRADVRRGERVRRRRRAGDVAACAAARVAPSPLVAVSGRTVVPAPRGRAQHLTNARAAVDRRATPCRSAAEATRSSASPGR